MPKSFPTLRDRAERFEADALDRFERAALALLARGVVIRRLERLEVVFGFGLALDFDFAFDMPRFFAAMMSPFNGST
jgi:hypothetical protein